MVPFDINAVVHDTVKLLERVIDKRIVVRLELNERIPSVQGDVNKMEQVLMNFMVNARDAMPYGGVITITSTAIDARPGVAGVPPYIPDGRYVVLSVADTGVGVPDRDKVHIFEPYFSTKRGGTGLGLAIVNSIVAEHQGFLRVEDNVPQGTSSSLCLPSTRWLRTKCSK